MVLVPNSKQRGFLFAILCGIIPKTDMSKQSYIVEVLQKKVRDAATLFVKHDSKLLDLKAHEQAMSHRIAYYLERQFKSGAKFNFDCEYNKNLEKTKRIDLDLVELKQHVSQLEICGCPACKSIPQKKHLRGKLFRPDILVHSRGDERRNLVAVEIKRKHFCPFDESKLKALTLPQKRGGKYRYQLGVFIFFPKGKPSFKWYLGTDSISE